jgi:peroxiredoxin
VALQETLDAITERTRSLVQPERLEPGERAIAELFADGIEQRILKPGTQAPEFALRESSGQVVRSADLLALGPLILNFFRGRWCPYCMTELDAWRALYPEMRSRGIMLAAISPQTEHQAGLLAQQHPLLFPVLSDPGLLVAERFGLVYPVPEYQQRHYRRMLVNVPFINGDPSWRLPLPATFAIASDGTILFAEAHADFRVRPEPADVLAAIVRS